MFCSFRDFFRGELRLCFLTLCFILSDLHSAKEWKALSTFSWYFCDPINSERKRIFVTISDYAMKRTTESLLGFCKTS